ncbi:MAG: DNA adenine methylase, partial [Dysgonomonas sp.]|nr:DNA adenine methylase [Dysgonomonas sp.]
AKHMMPECTVIYNDFDNFSRRLRNIDRTNTLLSAIRLIAANEPKEKRISSDCKEKILERVKQDEKSGFVDYITLSSSLMFSAKYVTNIKELSSESFYNNIKAVNYDFNPEEYLTGLDIVQCDYKELYEKYKDVPGVLFIIDPPYLSTDTTTYNSDKYWKLRDYLDVLKVLVSRNYIFFTSNKSSLVELCEWFADNKTLGNPFVDSVLSTKNVNSYNVNYTDMMLYKFIE